MSDNSREKKRPDYLSDVLDAVEALDKKRGDSSDLSREHTRAVRAVQQANSFHGKGFMSLSKARTILAYRYRVKKGYIEDQPYYAESR